MRPLRQALRRLLAEKKIVRQQGGWALPETERRVTGTMHVTRSGCGYLIPDDTSQDDLYIPEECLGSALHGDKVEVRIEKPRGGRDFRHFGRVLKVIERGSPRLVAVMTQDGKARPEDPRDARD